MSTLEPESSIWYAICWLVLITRIFSRRIHRGAWKHLQLDDYLIVLAMMTETVLMALMHIVVHTNSNLMAPGQDVSRLSQQDIDSRIFGSKLVVVVEQMQIITTWLVKACLLLMYYRMTSLLPAHKIVLGVAAYVAVGFVVMEILYLGVWCRPFTGYWAVPPPSSQCSAATNHLITNVVLNITSDLMIISIPMPLLFQVKLPKKQKAVLLGIFMIGTFTIVAAVLNKYYSFTHPFGTEWTIWYLRESYTAILCANLPLTYPLIQRIFKLRNWSYNSYHGTYPSASRPQPTTRSRFRSGVRSGIGGRPHPGGIAKTVTVSVSNMHGREMRRTESEEEINRLGIGAYDGQETFFVTSAIEMGELSPSSEKKEPSITTAGSVKSLEKN